MFAVISENYFFYFVPEIVLDTLYLESRAVAWYGSLFGWMMGITCSGGLAKILRPQRHLESAQLT
jgi:hypothetical protein